MLAWILGICRDLFYALSAITFLLAYWLDAGRYEEYGEDLTPK